MTENEDEKLYESVRNLYNATPQSSDSFRESVMRAARAEAEANFSSSRAHMVDIERKSPAASDTTIRSSTRWTKWSHREFARNVLPLFFTGLLVIGVMRSEWRSSVFGNWDTKVAMDSISDISEQKSDGTPQPAEKILNGEKQPISSREGAISGHTTEQISKNVRSKLPDPPASPIERAITVNTDPQKVPSSPIQAPIEGSPPSPASEPKTGLSTASDRVSSPWQNVVSGLDRESATIVAGILDSAKSHNLPMDGVVSRVREGVRRGIPSERVIVVTRNYVSALFDSKRILNTSNKLDQQAGAEALLAGAPEATVKSIRSARTSGPVAGPLMALAQLTSHGVGPLQAAKALTTMMAKGASDESIRVLRESVIGDIIKGMTPDAALAGRLSQRGNTLENRTNRQYPDRLDSSPVKRSAP